MNKTWKRERLVWSRRTTSKRSRAVATLSSQLRTKVSRDITVQLTLAPAGQPNVDLVAQPELDAEERNSLREQLGCISAAKVSGPVALEVIFTVWGDKKAWKNNLERLNFRMSQVS